MSVIRWKSFAAHAGAGLCATCIWGTVRRGFLAKEEEIFCRIISPNMRASFVVRDCTDYVDRRAPVTETKPDDRRYGFVTEISLEEKQATLARKNVEDK